MGHHKFIGEYTGKYNKTTVEGGKIQSSEGRATLKISEVGPGAYLETIVADGKTTFNVLSFENNGVLVAQANSGEGVTNTYFDGKCLIHQLSNKSPTVWLVKNYKFKRNKHH